MMAMIALRKDIARSNPRLGDIWEVCGDRELILTTPGNQLIFLEMLDVPDNEDIQSLLDGRTEQSEKFHAAFQVAAQQELERRFPAEHSALTRVKLHTNSRWVDSMDRLYQYQYHHFNALTYAEVYAPGRETYEGKDAAEAATLAKLKAQKGEPGVRVSEPFKSRWAHRNRHHYSNLSGDLLKHDCRFREDKASGQCYIVWDPKYARRMRRREAKTGGKSTSPAHIQVHEFWNCIRGLDKKIRKAYYLHYNELGRHNSSRYYMLCAFSNALAWICQAYGRHAYRHVEEWRQFMAIWKVRGEATWKNFGGRLDKVSDVTASDHYARLFQFFDDELTARKPRAANWKKMIAQRNYGLPDQVTEEDYLRNYDQAKLKQKYPETYKQLQKDNDRRRRRKRKEKEAAA